MDEVLNNMSIIDEVEYSDEESEDVVNLSYSSEKNSNETKPIEGVISDKSASYEDQIVTDLLNDFPELYAENITFEDNYLREQFYIRKCMQDIFLPEYKLLIGGKGTGKTFFL